MIVQISPLCSRKKQIKPPGETSDICVLLSLKVALSLFSSPHVFCVYFRWLFPLWAQRQQQLRRSQPSFTQLRQVHMREAAMDRKPGVAVLQNKKFVRSSKTALRVWWTEPKASKRKTNKQKSWMTNSNGLVSNLILFKIITLLFEYVSTTFKI